MIKQYTISEIQQKLKELEQKILFNIGDFVKETGYQPDIDVIRQELKSKCVVIVNYEVKAKLTI